MASYGCGLCLYGKNQEMLKTSVVCMVDNYSKHSLSDSCNKFKRDFSKNVVVKSVVKGQK